MNYGIVEDEEVKNAGVSSIDSDTDDDEECCIKDFKFSATGEQIFRYGIKSDDFSDADEWCTSDQICERLQPKFDERMNTFERFHFLVRPLLNDALNTGFGLLGGHQPQIALIVELTNDEVGE